MRERNIFLDIDWTTVFIYFALVCFGILCLISTTYLPEKMEFINTKAQYMKQIIFLGISLMFALVVLLLDAKFYSTFAFYIYGFVIVLLIAVLFIGKEIKGSHSWFVIGGFQFQPAELGKLAACLALAKYLVDANCDLDKWKQRIYSAVIIAIPALLVLIQGDAGSTMVYVALLLPLFREGLSASWYIAGIVFGMVSFLALVLNMYVLIGIIAVIAIFIIYKNLLRSNIIIVTVLSAIILSGYITTVGYVFSKLKPHQQDRVNVILGKKVDMRGIGYNLNQSKIAIGSGGFLGKGFMKGSQTKFNFVPEQHTDYIFCTVGEEYGFIGSLVLFSLYAGLLLRLIMIAERQRSQFSRIYIYGVIGILLFHSFVNIAMTMGLFPTIGIPLPFLSYGGSSLIAFTIMLFIVLRLDANRLVIFR